MTLAAYIDPRDLVRYLCDGWHVAILRNHHGRLRLLATKRGRR